MLERPDVAHGASKKPEETRSMVNGCFLICGMSPQYAAWTNEGRRVVKTWRKGLNLDRMPLPSRRRDVIDDSEQEQLSALL